MKRLQPLVVAVSQHGECRQLAVGIEALRSGGVIALPTDTIYGVAALAQSRRAVQYVYHIKRRIEAKPLAICVGSVQQVYKWCDVTISQSLLEALLPGPVTLVFARRAELNPSLNPGNPLVGIRIPDYALIQDICNQLDEPIALTSANISNGLSAVDIQEFKELWPDIDIIYDGGRLGETEKQRLGSTVVNLSVSGHFSIIRSGSAQLQTRQLLLLHNLVEDGLRS